MLLHALADGELDAANALVLEEHIAVCGGCAVKLADIRRQKTLLAREDLRYKAPVEFRERLMSAVAQGGVPDNIVTFRPRSATSQTRHVFLERFSRGGLALSLSGMALAASLILFASVANEKPVLDDELVAGHIRSLLAQHLTDVASSDQHTVKPWFLGRLDFSPPVIDLADKDFSLIGGREDYIGGRTVAALVYKRRGHVINLFICPVTMGAKRLTKDGYNVERWTMDKFTFAAVSDLNLSELADFRRELTARF
jgi:anti-sigma factor RsiW